MERQTFQGNIVFSDCGFIIFNSKIKDLDSVLKEISKLVPHNTKVKDIKKMIIDKISIVLT